MGIPMRYVAQARPRTRTLSPQEIRIYLQTLCQSNIRRQFKLALHLILLTLVRKGEMILAKWSMSTSTPANGTYRAKTPRQANPTSFSCRVRPLNSSAGFMNSLQVRLGYAWSQQHSQTISKTALNQALEGVTFAIQPFTIHDMRRTSSTLLHEKGFSSDVVEKALNPTAGGVRGIFHHRRTDAGRLKISSRTQTISRPPLWLDPPRR
jgi:integrase